MIHSTETNLYRLNDDYSIEFVNNSDHQLILKLYCNRMLQHSVVLHDRECSGMTNRLCETTQELQDVLIDLLTTVSLASSIRVIDVNYLNITFPIYFGSDRTRSKQWSFKIEFFDMKNANQVSLDPQNWAESRSLGYKIVDDMIDYLRDCRLRPPWRPMPMTVKQTIQQTPIPLRGRSPWEVYDEVCSLIVPYSIGTHHPHFWGYVAGSGSIIGAFAEFITGIINTMAWGGHQASTYIEYQVLSWFKALMGFPIDNTSSGILVSGTSVATIIAMAVARKKFANQIMKIYLSKESHHCLIRAIDLLNIGRENIVLIPTNSERQIDVKVKEQEK